MFPDRLPFLNSQSIPASSTPINPPLSPLHDHLHQPGFHDPPSDEDLPSDDLSCLQVSSLPILAPSPSTLTQHRPIRSLPLLKRPRLNSPRTRVNPFGFLHTPLLPKPPAPRPPNPPPTPAQSPTCPEPEPEPGSAHSPPSPLISHTDPNSLYPPHPDLAHTRPTTSHSDPLDEPPDESDGYEHAANKKKRKVPSPALHLGLPPSPQPLAGLAEPVSDSHNDDHSLAPPALPLPMYADPAELAKGLSSHYVKMRKKPLGSPHHYGRRLARARHPPLAVSPPPTPAPHPRRPPKRKARPSPKPPPILETPVLPNLYDPRIPLTHVLRTPERPAPPARQPALCSAEFSFRLEVPELTARLSRLHVAIDGAKRAREAQMRQALQKVAPPIEPPPAAAVPNARKQQTKGKGKKRRAAHANANNIHHRSNYVFSRQPAKTVGRTASGAPGPGVHHRPFIDPTLTLSLDGQSGVGHAQLGPSRVASVLLVEPEEWVCAFCEYAIWFGDQKGIRRVVVERRNKLAGRKRQSKKSVTAKGAAGVARNTGSAPSRNCKDDARHGHKNQTGTPCLDDGVPGRAVISQEGGDGVT